MGMCSPSGRGWFMALAAAAFVLAGIGGTPYPISIPAALLVASAIYAVLTLVIMRRCKRHPVLADDHLDSHVLSLFAGGIVGMTIAFFAFWVALYGLGALVVLGVRPVDVPAMQRIALILSVGRRPPLPPWMSPEMISWLRLERTPRNIVMAIYNSFIASAATEEVLKWFMVRVSLNRRDENETCCFQPRSSRSVRATALLMVSVALGFALIESLLILWSAPPALLNQLVVAALRLLVPIPFHACTALWSAARLSKRDLEESGPAFELRTAPAADAPPEAGGTPALLTLSRREMPDPMLTGQVTRCGRARSTCVVLAPSILVNGLYQFVVWIIEVSTINRSTGFLSLEAGFGVYGAGAAVMLLAAFFARREFIQALAREDLVADLTEPGPPPVAGAAVASVAAASPLPGGAPPSASGSGAEHSAGLSGSRGQSQPSHTRDYHAMQDSPTGSPSRQAGQTRTSTSDVGLQL